MEYERIREIMREILHFNFTRNYFAKKLYPSDLLRYSIQFEHSRYIQLRTVNNVLLINNVLIA